MKIKTLLLSSSLTFTSLMMFSTTANLCQKMQQRVAENNLFLQGTKYQVVKKQWHKRANWEKAQFSINHQHQLIIDDHEEMIITLVEAENYDLVFHVLARQVQKMYELNVKTNELIDMKTVQQSLPLQQALKNLIVKDFYEQNTTRRFLSKDNYYVFFDTRKPAQGEMINNGNISFNSSWGVWNKGQNETKFKFYLQDDILKNHILMAEEKEWGKLKKENIAIQTIKPHAMGFLPIAQINKPPIGEAYWTLKSIDFQNKLMPKIIYDAKQKLLLPENHNSGAEWWRGLTSFVTAILQIVSLGGGAIAGFLGQTIMSVITSTISTVAGVSTFINDMTRDNDFAKISNTHFDQLKNQKEGFKKINELIMKESVVLANASTIDYQIFDIVGIAPIIEGQLEGWANATSLWAPTNSAMSLYTVWNTMSADINYLVYQ